MIESFLPQLASEDQTRAWVAAAIEQTGASGPREMGKVMGALMKAHRDEIDGSLARQLVQQALQS